MKDYHVIPDRIIRLFAKKKGIQKLRGKEMSDIIASLITSGHQDGLDHLYLEFAFTRNSSGLTIDRLIGDFPESCNSPEKFISILIEREIIPPDYNRRVNWEVPLEDKLQICGILVDGHTVFMNIVQKKLTKRKTGWNGFIVDAYADITPLVVHFNNPTIEYRAPATQISKLKAYVLELLNFENEVHFERLTKVTNNDAVAIKSFIQANFSSEQISLPSTVGSIRLNSSKGTNDLEKDDFAEELRKFLQQHNFPPDDRMDVTCHIEEFTDTVTEITFPVTFDINIKAGGFKFKSFVTQSVIDNVFDAIIEVCYIQKQQAIVLPEASIE